VTLRIPAARRPRVIWLLALLTFLFGCHLAVSIDSAINSTNTAAEQLARWIEANDRTIAQAAAMRRREQLAWRDLMRVSHERRPAVSVAEFLRSLESLARRLHIIVLSITPSADSGTPSARRNVLAPLPVTVLLHGNFRSIVYLMQEMTRQKSLTGLDGVNIAVSTAASSRTRDLTATLHLTLYRLLLKVADAPTD